MRKLSLSLLAIALWAQEPDMIPIPAAKCPMGVSVSHEDVHQAETKAFRLSKTPITNAQYKLFIDDTSHPPPGRNSIGSNYQLWTGREFPQEIAAQPVVNVSWVDASAYCQWLSKKTGKPYRLPTEEEWEIAARGGLTGKPYPWGDGIDKTKAWFDGKWKGTATLRPADFGKPNPYGLLGMAGNVWQWVEDWYVPVFNDRPVQEELKMFRVIRGGSWADGEAFLTVNYRNFHPPDFKDFFVGFRVALPSN